MAKCRASGDELIEVFDLGKQALGNGFLDEKDFINEYFYDLKVGYSESSCLLQLVEQPDPEKMFHEEYAFFSGTSKLMTKHFSEWASQILEAKSDNNFIIEIGCNDGIFLQNFVGTDHRYLGIEPSKNVAAEAKTKGIPIKNKFMNKETANEILNEYGRADYITSANVICHIPNIIELAESVEMTLKDSGLFIFEEPYLGDIVEKCSYDQIYDEHVYLFSCLSVQYIFKQVGLELVKAEHQTTHGGSMRYYLGKQGNHVIDKSVENFINIEKSKGLNSIQSMRQLGLRIKKSKEQLIATLSKIKDANKTIVGYAATSKSTTILNYCNIGPDIISSIYDTTIIKQGKYSPGMHIPVKPWEEFSVDKPDYAFLFAWNHIDEIMAKESTYSSSGGKWITHVPNVRIL